MELWIPTGFRNRSFTLRNRAREEIARALEGYCGLDTEGMIEIVERLKSLVWRPGPDP